MQNLCKPLAVLIAFTFYTNAMAQEASHSNKEAGNDQSQPVRLDFVQQATSMSFTDNKLTLKGVPATLFFSDRPERITGQITTPSFVQLWSETKGDFKSDPPNAAVALTGSPESPPTIVEIEDAILNGDDLVYTIKILEGKLPASSDAGVTVFIDPWVWRRPLRRVAHWRGPRGGFCHYSYYLHHGICNW